MNGYTWLHNREGKTMHANITDVYDEYKKNGWSMHQDLHDLEPVPVKETVMETPLITAAKKTERHKRIK